MSATDTLHAILATTFLLLDDGDRRLFGRFQLTAPRFYALFHIGNEPGITSSQLSIRLLCDKSNATRILRGLEAEGLIERKPHETDGRSMRLYLTEAGKAVREQVAAAHQAYNQARLGCLDPMEQEELIRCLTKLNESLKANLS